VILLKKRRNASTRLIYESFVKVAVNSRIEYS
jgi:hypothetical protein